MRTVNSCFLVWVELTLSQPCYTFLARLVLMILHKTICPYDVTHGDGDKLEYLNAVLDKFVDEY